MGYPESQYIVDETVNKLVGVPPDPVVTAVVTLSETTASLTFTPPEDTLIDNNLFCTVGGVKIVIKADSAPATPSDGTLIVDLDRDHMGNYKTSAKTFTIPSDGHTYYVGVFPYSDHGVANYQSYKSAIPSA